MKALDLKEEQFVTDAHGHRVAVLVDLKTYKRLCEAAEDLDDIRAYDAAHPKALADLQSGQYSTLAAYRAKRAKAK